MLNRLWREDEGVLTFEWVLLVTVLVIGVVVGLAAVRDALNVELANVAGAMVSLNQGYGITDAGQIAVGIKGSSATGLNSWTCTASGSTAASMYMSGRAIGATPPNAQSLVAVGTCP
jgi:hypothetical protein